MRIRAHLRVVAVVSLLASTCGCGTDASTVLRSLGSWAATGAMVAEAWAAGATPRAYAARTLERAQRQLAEQTRELGTVPARQRTLATPITERVQKGLRELTDAVRAGNRAAARTLASSLAEDARRLQALGRREAS